MKHAPAPADADDKGKKGKKKKKDEKKDKLEDLKQELEMVNPKNHKYNAALSKCAGNWQFCRLHSISCLLLHIGLHYEPSSRQGDLVFAAFYSFYVAYCYKTFWQGWQCILNVDMFNGLFTLTNVCH